MYKSMKASRKGRNLYNYSNASLVFKGSTRRNTTLGWECPQNRMAAESFMKNSNYDGRPPPPEKKCTTLRNAIATEEQKRQSEPPPFRPRPGYLGDSPEPCPEMSPTQPSAPTGELVSPPSKARVSWIDTRQSPAQERQHQLFAEERQLQTPSRDGGGGQEADSFAVGRRASMPVKVSQGPLQAPSPARRSTSPPAVATQDRLGTSPPAVATQGRLGTSPPVAATQEAKEPMRVAPGYDGGAVPPRPSPVMQSPLRGTRSPRSPNNSCETSRASDKGSGGSQFGGIGERMDPKAWAITTERHQKRQTINSAHYEYIVQQLRRREEAIDGEREELDQELLHQVIEPGMCSALMCSPRMASSPRMARSASTPKPMGTAFTDRSLRKREGLGSRAALHEGSPSETSGGHSDCGCAVCKPFHVKSAGQLSHSVHSNIIHPAHQGSEAVLPPQTPRTPDIAFGKRVAGSTIYDSNRLQRIFKESPRSPSGGTLDDLDEHALHTQMGRKTKPAPAAVRSLSAEPNATAGRYRRRMELDLDGNPYQRHLGEGMARQARSEVSMILSPRDNDPPRSMKITGCKRADGEHKYGLSKEAEKSSVHWNQPLYKYEVASVNQTEGNACSSPRWTATSPADYLSFPPGGYGNPRCAEYCEGSAGDFMPRGIGITGNGRVKGPAASYDGSRMAELTNHVILAQCAAQEREERLVTDARFANMCTITQDVAQVHSRSRKDIKQRYVCDGSQKMANALKWDE